MSQSELNLHKAKDAHTTLNTHLLKTLDGKNICFGDWLKHEPWVCGIVAMRLYTSDLPSICFNI